MEGKKVASRKILRGQEEDIITIIDIEEVKKIVARFSPIQALVILNQLLKVQSMVSQSHKVIMKRIAQPQHPNYQRIQIVTKKEIKRLLKCLHMKTKK
jgi:hypothetical protein